MSLFRDSGGLELVWVAGRYGICRLGAEQDVPEWGRGAFVTVSRTRDELSVVCDFDRVPDEIAAEGPFLLLRVAGQLELGLVGILASLAGPLATAEVPIFAISTFDTDYLLVHEPDRARAEAALAAAGHRFLPGHPPS
jgi:hypothetical protein